MGTCTALDQFIVNTDASRTNCNRDEACTTVTCDTVDLMFREMVRTSIVTLQPCSRSIRLGVIGTNDTVLFNMTLNASTEVPLAVIPTGDGEQTVTVSLCIMLDTSVPKEIGIETDLVQVFSFNGERVPEVINGNTRIPLDLSQCPTEPATPPTTRRDSSAPAESMTTEMSGTTTVTDESVGLWSTHRVISLLSLSLLANLLMKQLLLSSWR